MSMSTTEELRNENNILKERVKELEYEIAQQHLRHMNAGRRADEAKKLEQRDYLVAMEAEGKSVNQIIEKMQISRSTYFRLKKYEEMVKDRDSNNCKEEPEKSYREVQCRHQYRDEDGNVEDEVEWTAKWSVTRKSGDITFLSIEGRGSSFKAIIGEYAGGNFICIPAIDVGCGLAEYSDVLWNTEKLAGHIGETDAVTVAEALRDFEESVR